MNDPQNRRGKRPGMPAAASVVEEKAFVPGGDQPSAAVAGGAPAYRILRTTEVDPYDPPVTAAAVPAIGAAPPQLVSDDFRGTARKAAKTSLSGAAIEEFDDLEDLIQTLPKHSKMVNRQPRISTDRTSNRVAEEKRNVRLAGFLYAASREDDSDYHLIVGRDPDTAPSLCMTVEISGLPRSNSAAFGKLSAARTAYKSFFGSDLPGTSYDFYDPPIPVEIEGSLFFDMSHAKGSRPGPQSLRPDMPVVWEIHPVSRIEFEP
jgi:hypothetical protein